MSSQLLENVISVLVIVVLLLVVFKLWNSKDKPAEYIQRDVHFTHLDKERDLNSVEVEVIGGNRCALSTGYKQYDSKPDLLGNMLLKSNAMIM